MRRWSGHFSPVIRQRGQHYFADGRVELRRSDGRRLAVDVRCSQMHRVSIDLDAPAQELGAHCDCGYFRGHGPCKHIWAALLALDVSAAAVPVAREKRRGAPASAQRAGGLTYVLDLDRARERGWASVEIHPPVGSDDGGVSGRPLRVHRDDVVRLPDAWDRRLLAGLFGLDLDDGASDAGAPSGDDGSPRSPVRTRSLLECSAFPLNHLDARYFVELLAETGRFHLRRRGVTEVDPVVWEGGRAWRFGIAFSGGPLDSECELRGFLEREGESLPLERVPYILQGIVFREARAAPIDTGDAGDWLDKLNDRGPYTLPLRERDALLERLHERERPPLVKFPPGWELEEQAPSPRPVVRIEALAESEPGEGVSCRLFFQYPGRRIADGHPGARICLTRECRVVPRHLAVEAEARELFGALCTVSRDEDGATHAILAATALASAVDRFRDAGWSVDLRDRPYRGVGTLRARVHSGIDWFELEAELDFAGQKVPIGSVLEAIRRGRATVELPDGSTGVLPEQWRHRLRLLGNAGTLEGGRLRFSRRLGWMLDALLDEDLDVESDAGFGAFREELRAREKLQPMAEPPGFVGELRPYQREGLAWLTFLTRSGIGGCLADDMGLGKTVQVLALLAHLRAQDGPQPSLVVAPRSVVYNWVDEARRFTPDLRVLDYSGPLRHEQLLKASEYDLLVTSYGLLRRDIETLRKQQFRCVILDEAQAIKNPGSLTARSARLLDGRHRLGLSGTPVENRVAELGSILEFLNPGMLGETSLFRGLLSTRSLDKLERELLAVALRPYLLRRTKEQVARDLPEKTEQIFYCEMESSQQEYYDAVSRDYRALILGLIDNQGIDRSRMHILEALLRLRQVACHPGLVDPQRTSDASCKLEVLLPQIREVVAEGHKTLVFSQFTSFLALVRERLEEEGLVYEYLDGATRNRKARVERFQGDPDCRIFLISLKAGGLGINLTAADYVFILDPWWNPAVEAQAIDRAHRIGQTRHVLAYRLITRGTVEEKILELQAHKRALADSIISSDGSVIEGLTRDQIERLLT